MSTAITAASMAARFDEHQQAAFNRLRTEITSALYGPRKASDPPKGQVLALIAPGGAGKTEVALAALRGVLEYARELEAAREAELRRAQERAREQAEEAMRQAKERARSHPQTPPQPKPQESWDDPFEDVRFADEEAVAAQPSQWRRRESAADRKAREKAEREAAELAALRDITVSFADDE